MQRTYQLSEIAPTRAEGELAALLLREGRRQRFSGGKLIQQQGDEGDGFWLIESGTVSLCRFAADGSVTVFAILGAGDLFGELAYFAGVSRQVDAIADEDAVLVRIGGTLIERLLTHEPNFARWLLKSLANQMRLALDRIERDRSLSAELRIARALADMTRRDGPVLSLTQQALAELVGVSRVTTGQVLRGLSAAGLVRQQYRRIVVIDTGGLETLAKQPG
ncbi:MAG: Crp/Fnr family transcriptional regulator [Proteobacteria bacterium]|nr:Crp/Fnr family transcriptional regulator [Pseudomonadota bacterium]